MSKVCCVQAKTLKFSPHDQLHKVTYGPKYRPPRTLATGTKKTQKNLDSFFPQNGGENYFRFRFSAIFVFSTLDLVDSAKNRKKISGALFRDIWRQSWKIQKHFKWVTRISHSRFFDILWPLCPSTTVLKFIHFQSVINFLGKCAFLDLADFWLIFRLLERIEVCAFISRKLNKLRGPFFIFPDTFTPSVSIANKYSTWGSYRGLQRPQIGPTGQNFKIVTFSRGSGDQTVRPRGSMIILFCTPEGPLVNTLTGFKRPLQYCPQVIEIAPPPKNLHPIFAKLSGVGANFLSSLYGDAQGPSEKKFGQLYLGPLTGNRISKFRGKSIFFELREIFVQRKILTVCAGVPPQ